MNKNQFYYEIEELSNNDIRIKCHEELSSEVSIDDDIVISRHSIPELIALLKHPKYIPQREDGSFKNKYDFIQISTGGHEGHPSLCVFNYRETITGNENDNSIIHIPLDAMSERAYKYIDPLIEDLKKYIIE